MVLKKLGISGKNMTYGNTNQMIRLLTIFALSCSLGSCEKHPKDLSSYESAARWIKAEYKAEVMKPDSTAIHKVEYYSKSPEKWLLVYFNTNKSKGYIYQGFRADRWQDWKKASSKGKWYHKNLKGVSTYVFTPHK